MAYMRDAGVGGLKDLVSARGIAGNSEPAKEKSISERVTRILNKAQNLDQELRVTFGFVNPHVEKLPPAIPAAETSHVVFELEALEQALDSCRDHARGIHESIA
jgi:hypothetical protein